MAGGDEEGGRNDFLGSLENGLRSFGINPGGYVGFYDPQTGGTGQAFGNDAAEERANIKANYGFMRRSNRYRDRRMVIEKAKAENDPNASKTDEIKEDA